VRKQEGDKSGLIYGRRPRDLYQIDPRTLMLKKTRRFWAEQTGMIDEFLLIDSVERLAPPGIERVRGENRVMCGNWTFIPGSFTGCSTSRRTFSPRFSRFLAHRRLVGPPDRGGHHQLEDHPPGL
jgi:hypothetical protein